MNYDIYFKDIIYFKNHPGILTSFLYFSYLNFLMTYDCLEKNLSHCILGFKT